MKKNLLAAVSALVLSAGVLGAQTYDCVIDKTVAVVGNEAVLISDVEAEVMNSYTFQGIPTDRNTRCSVLEMILTNKLFLMQARIDSLSVNQDMVTNAMNQRIDEMIAYYGGQAALEERMKKPLYKYRDEMRKAYEDLGLIQQMQAEIKNKLPKLTPKDVRNYLDTVDKEVLPVVPEQYQMSHIVLYPDKESAAMAAKERLLEIRERVMNGEKFSMLARIYSQDGSANKGGELGMYPKSIYWPAFSDAAMSLKEGQVSQIVETPDGFHLIQMIEKEGDSFNARHILIRPQYTYEDQSKAFARLDSIRTEIQSGSITFEMAARLYSEDTHTRANGGQMTDQYTGSAIFDKDRIQPDDYNAVKSMKPGEISEPFESKDNEGRGNVIYKILRLDKVIPSHTAAFDTDYDLLLRIATNDRDNKAVDDFLKEKIKTTYIVLDPIFRGCSFKYDGWFKDEDGN